MEKTSAACNPKADRRVELRSVVCPKAIHSNVSANIGSGCIDESVHSRISLMQSSVDWRVTAELSLGIFSRRVLLDAV